LYVARSQRGLINDAEVWAALSGRGFERVEPTTWEDNVKKFASADLVVGPHGAGLSNVIFCPPGARLVELVPGDRPFPYFYSAASAAGLSYSALLTTPLLPAGREYQKLPSDEPYGVDLQKLCTVVDAAIAR
jgi:capsular polysaccharide biosynthesis protein